MKKLQGKGVGVNRKQAEPILLEEKEQLWKMGVLGAHTPQSLLNTMVYMCGLYFALCSGQEHRNLQLSQKPPGGVPYIEYTENVSKSRPGGLKHRKIEPKKVKLHANYQRSEKCFVQLFKAYCAHRPPKAEHDSFYLTPFRNPRPIVWYQVTPVAHHTLANTVRQMCSSAGVDGYKTNHLE